MLSGSSDWRNPPETRSTRIEHGAGLAIGREKTGTRHCCAPIPHIARDGDFRPCSHCIRNGRIYGREGKRLVSSPVFPLGVQIIQVTDAPIVRGLQTVPTFSSPDGSLFSRVAGGVGSGYAAPWTASRKDRSATIPSLIFAIVS